MTTISSDYLAQQKTLHENKSYGKASVGYAPLVVDVLKKTGFRSVADYGAGKCRLKAELEKYVNQFEYYPYDPAFPEYGKPTPADLVVCIDVLEHIELDFLDDVLNQLKQMTLHVGLFTIHTGDAKKILSDGRNAHLIQQPATWWLEKILPHFDVIQLTPVKKGFWVIVEKKGLSHSKSLLVKKMRFGFFNKLIQKLGFGKI
jgi:hypothetical protein